MLNMEYYHKIFFQKNMIIALFILGNYTNIIAKRKINKQKQQQNPTKPIRA